MKYEAINELNGNFDNRIRLQTRNVYTPYIDVY